MLCIPGGNILARYDFSFICERRSRPGSLARSPGGNVPTLDAAVAEIARLAAELTLPKGTIHVISDIHGEDAKLRHVINNASGTLRPLVERLFADRLPAAELQEFLTLIFYPGETLERLRADAGRPGAAPGVLPADACSSLFEIVRVARAGVQPASDATASSRRSTATCSASCSRAGRWHADRSLLRRAIVDALVRHDRASASIRLTVRVVRNLPIDELIIGGDCWDRGPRGDRVVDYLHAAAERRRSSGATTTPPGSAPASATRPCIAHVLRISLRYRRLVAARGGLRHPPAAAGAPGPRPSTPTTRPSCFVPKGDRPARHRLLDGAGCRRRRPSCSSSSKARSIARNPEWGLDHRRLLHRIDRAAGTIDDRRQDATRCKDTPLPDARPGRPVRAVGRGADLHGPAPRVVPHQPEAVGAHAVPGRARLDVPGRATTT